MPDTYPKHSEFAKLSPSQLGEAVNQSSEVIVISDTSLQIQYVNPAFELLFGYSLDEIQGKNVSILLPDGHDLAMTNPVEFKEFKGEKLRRAKNGKIIPVLLKIAPIKDINGECTGFVGTMTGLTEIREATARMTESEERFRSLADAAPVLIWMAGQDKLCNWFNDTWLKYTGRPKERELGVGWVDGVHPEDLNICLETYHSKFNARLPFQMEYRLRGHDGEFRWFIDVGKPRFDHQGVFVGYIGMLTDITERKVIELELLENRQKLAEAQQIAHLGSWDWNIANGHVSWSDEAAEIYVPDNKTVTPSFEAFKSSLYAEDFDKVMGAIQSTLSQDAPYDIEHRVVSNSKGVRYVHAQGRLFRNSAGEAIRLVGTVLDITERKILENELKRQAHNDYLTGLSNRRHFMEQAELELSRAIRYDSPLSLMMMDIDLFKQVNDTHGHKAGDYVLKKLAEICINTLREIDIVGRIGGEEFAVLLPETEKERAVEVADRLRIAFEGAKVVLPSGGLPLRFTVSIGLASLSSKDDNMDVLLSLADKALYEAKNSGRNKVCIAPAQ